jgi:hypothetical protein
MRQIAVLQPASEARVNIRKGNELYLMPGDIDLHKNAKVV